MSEIEYKEEFIPVGEAREVNVTVAEGVMAPNAVFTVQFGEWHKKPTEKEPHPGKSGRWALSREITVDGAIQHVTKYSTGVDKLIENEMAIVYGAFNIPLDQVLHDADFEDEYFAQKISIVTDDVYKMTAYADKLSAFNEARGEIEATLDAAEGSAETTQADYHKVATILTDLKEQVGGNMKLLKSIVNGGEDGKNQSRLIKLGKSDNALNEAMWLATISEAEMSILPVTITSGKSGNRHVTKALQAIAETSYIKEVEFEDFIIVGKDGSEVIHNLPTPESLGHMLRAIADRSFGVKEARAMADGEYTSSLGEVATLVNEAAIKRAVEFRAKYGKHADTYDKDQYAEALGAFGATRCSDAGAVNLFAEAVMKADEAVDSGDDYAAKVNSMISTRGNLLMRHAVTNAKTMIDQNAKTAEIKETVEAMDTDTVDTVALKDMSAMAKAAYHYKLIAGYADAGDVWNELKALCANKALENKAKQSAE